MNKKFLYYNYLLILIFCFIIYRKPIFFANQKLRCKRVHTHTHTHQQRERIKEKKNYLVIKIKFTLKYFIIGRKKKTKEKLKKNENN